MGAFRVRRNPWALYDHDPEFDSSLDKTLTYVTFGELSDAKSPVKTSDMEELELWSQDAFDSAVPEKLQVVSPRRRIGSNQIDFEELYHAAEAGATAVEASSHLGVPVHTIHNQIRAHFNMGWKEYADIATQSVDLEMKMRILDAIRRGASNNNFLIMYAKRFLGYDTPKKIELTGKDGGPIQSTYFTMSDEELVKKREELLAVINRPKSFDVSLLPATVTVEVLSQGGENG